MDRSRRFSRVCSAVDVVVCAIGIWTPVRIVVRVAYLGLCLLPLLILPSALAIFVLPQVEDALQHAGMASPSIFRLARAVRLDVTNPIMTVMAVMVAPMLAFATARTYVLSASTAPDN